RVAQGNRSAVYVYFFAVQFQHLVVGQGNHRKGLVDFVEVHFLRTNTCCLHGQGNGFGRGGGKLFWSLLRIGIAKNARQRLQAQFLHFLFADQYQCPAPSFRVDALAAVTVPSFLKTGFNCGILSKLTELISSSSSTTVTSPLRPVISTGTISFLNLPSLSAFCARLYDSMA